MQFDLWLDASVRFHVFVLPCQTDRDAFTVSGETFDGGDAMDVGGHDGQTGFVKGQNTVGAEEIVAGQAGRKSRRAAGR